MAIKGLALDELAAQLEQRREAKKDWLVPQGKITLDAVVKQTENQQEAERLLMVRVGDLATLRPSDRWHSQTANTLSIPKPYYDRMKQEAPVLLAENVNHWLHSNPGQIRLLRSMAEGNDGRVVTGIARALLSKRYRIIDHELVADAILPILCDVVQGGREISFRAANVTEENLYLQVVFPEEKHKLRTKIHQSNVGDEVLVGFMIRNNEVGAGSFRIEPFLEVLACSNGMTMSYAMRRHHLGRNVEPLEEAREIFRDDTMKLDDRALMMKMRDTVRAACDRNKIQEEIDRVERVMDDPITTDLDQIQAVMRKDVSDGESKSILSHLAQGGRLDRWGLANAITATANDAGDIERAVVLQDLGGQIMQRTGNDWAALAAA